MDNMSIKLFLIKYHLFGAINIFNINSTIKNSVIPRSIQLNIDSCVRWAVIQLTEWVCSISIWVNNKTIDMKMMPRLVHSVYG